MYSTSNKYKEQIYLGKECLLNVYIDGNLINDDDIYSFKVSHNLFDSSKVSLGSTTSKSIELEINQKALPETYSHFYIETGLTINGEDEIVPIGYFTLEDIKKDEDVVSITAVDYMMKFEKNISDSVTGTALEVLQAICDICGVKLATTDFMGYDTEISITNTLTARQVIGYIAELAGGFARIGREGKLYIKRIGENTTEIDIELFGDYSWGEKFVCNEVDFISDTYDYEISDTDFSSAYLDCILDSPLYDNELEGQPLKLNSNNPFITNEEQVQSIYNKLACLELNSFTGQVLIDPALDIGDIIYIDNKPVVYQGDMEYLGYFKGNITSTIETEEKSNTTVQTISLASKLKQVTNKVEEVTEKVSEVETNVENKVNTDEVVSTVNNAILNGENIESEDGSTLVSKDGVLSNLQFNSEFVNNGTLSDLSQIGYYFSVGNYLAYLFITATIPSNFKILNAYITITHQPLEYSGTVYDGAEEINLDGVIGYARNVQIYHSASEFEGEGPYLLTLNSEWTYETYIVGTDTKTLGDNGKTFDNNNVEIVKSSDLSEYLEPGETTVFKIGSTVDATELTSIKEMYQKTGRAVAILNVLGYLKEE